MASAVHILMSDYILDSRVRNETTSLVSEGYDITVLCLNSSKTQSFELREGVKIKRFGISNGIVRMLTAYWGFLFFIIKSKPNIIHAHDFTGYLIGYLASALSGIPVIYDSHELWSEALHKREKGLVLSTAFRVEKWIASRADTIITVSESIKNYMIKYFSNPNVHTVYNTPSYYNQVSERSKSKQLTFIYQGLISEGRGVRLIIDALKIMPRNDYRFLFVGAGPFLEELKLEVQYHNLEETVEIIGFVNQDELYKYTQKADIGVHCISNSCLNHWYCLPNKLFEYIHSDLVLLTSNMLELEKVIEQYQIGEVFEDNQAASLADKMNRFLDNRELITEYQVNLKKAQADLNWDNEFLKLDKIYQSILGDA